MPVGNEEGQLAFFGSDNAGIPSVEAAKREAAPQNRPNFDFFNYAGIHRSVWLYMTPAVGIGGGAAVNPYKEYPLAEHHRQGPMRVDGNKKGLFTRDRRPKLCAHFLRRRWADIPTFEFKK